MPTSPPPDWVLARRRELGDQLREARRAQRLSQERVAELAGLDRQAVNRIEQGHQSPILDNLIRIAAVLHLEVVLADLVQVE